MIIKHYIKGPIENNNYLVIDEKNKLAVLIDATEYSDDIVQDIINLDCQLSHILLTHGHFDHVGGVSQFKSRFNCKILMHEADVNWLNNVNVFLPQFGLEPVEIPVIDEFINDGDIINIGDLHFKVISTPGHTKGSVCFLLENILFSGDTLFKGCVGRCDLPGGSYKEIQHSIKDKLFKLPDDTIIYSGHGEASTIGNEKRFNIEI